MEQGVFVASAVMGLAYFLLKRRRFDFAALGFFSSLIYFIPGLFGLDAEGASLHDLLYYVFAAVLLSMIGLGIVWDYIARPISASASDRADPSAHAAFLIAFTIAVCALIAILASAGLDELLKPKREQEVGFLQITLWRVPASLALMGGFILKRRWVFVTGILLEGLLFLSGDRTGPALAVVALLTLHWMSSGHQRWVLANYRAVPLIATLAAFLLFGKIVLAGFYATQNGSASTIWDVWALESLDITLAFTKTEPFVTQMVLNRIVQTGFSADSGYLVGAFAQVLPVPSVLGFESAAFNDLFQPRLFAEYVPRSLAYNFWAEAWAVGGFLIVALYIGVYVVGLALFQWASGFSNRFWAAVAVLMGCYWAFYIHRNSLLTILAFERQILYVSILCFLLGLTLATITYRRFGRVEPS